MSDVTAGIGTGVRTAIIRTSRLAASEANGGSAFRTSAMRNETCGLQLEFPHDRFIPGI